MAMNRVSVKPKDKKIRFFTYEETGDSVTGTSPVKVYLSGGYRYWAYYRSLSGREYFSSGAVQEGQDAEFIINYNPEINTSMHIEYNGKVYDILFVDNFEGYKGDMKISAKLTEGKNDNI